MATRKSIPVYPSRFETIESRKYLAAHIVGSAVNYTTIQAAVNAASPSAVITVDAGTYAEQVTINKTLTIRGAKTGVDARTRSTTGESILTGGASGTARTASFYIAANNVTIDGFTVQGETDKSTTRGAGIVIAPNMYGTTIRNNIVQNNVAGIFLANNSTTVPALIQNNLFQNNNNAGINGGRGIYTDGEIAGTNLTNVTIDNNTFKGNTGGSGTTGLEAAVAFEAQTAGRQSNIRFTNNTESGNGKGILFFNTTGVLIQGNSVTTSRDWYSGAVRFEGNNHNVTITKNNIFANTGPGVAVDSNGTPGDSSGFVVTKNNIYGNGTTSGGKLGVVFNQSVYDGAFDATGNYWGAASGPSGDGPGTGDSVYGNASKATAWRYAKGGIETFSPWATSTIDIFAAPTVPSAPSAVAATALTSTQIRVYWTITATDATSQIVQRSVDGINFATVATLGTSATTFTDNSLAAGTKYYYRVYAVNAVGNSAPSATVSATTVSAASVVTQLSSLNWTSATAGYGTVQKNLSIGGNAIKLRGTTYASGIGTHAASTIVYNLAGKYTSFLSDVGVDDEVVGKGTGSVQFKVIGDGRTLYDSGIVTSLGAVKSLNLDVTGVTTLTLTAASVNGNIDYAHADWAGARLLSALQLPAAPINVTAAGLTTTSIKLAWAAGNGSAATAFKIERSLDGTTWSPLTTVAATVLSYTDTGLANTTTYFYRIRASNTAGDSANSATVSAKPIAATAITTQLSSLNWTSATAGYGSVQKNLNASGDPLNIGGVDYASGIGTHADSTIVYNLAGGYTTFQSDIGYDNRTAGKPSDPVYFQVIADGQVIYDSGTMINTDPAKSISLNVTGVTTLTLVVKAVVAGNIDYCHVDWAGAQLISNA
ncbi:MAG: hypothetical protein JWM57_4371 [Phycisphaerales bacterium]|nr:hypothetical protein [Phycisphaerales bacterium]